MAPTEDATPPDPSAAAIDVQTLHKSFGDLEVLTGIDFHVDPGEVVCVVGPSGSGKSTLLRCINLLEAPTAGRVLIEGRRDPEGAEAYALHDGHIVVRTENADGIEQFALSPNSLTGLLSWLESSPPGRGVNNVL